MKNTLAKKQPILLLLPIFVAAFATNPHDQCCFATDAPASAASAASATQAAKSLLNPFFAMDTGVRDTTHTTFASQTQMIADLGYAGMDHMGLRAIPEKLKELDARHLKLFAIYTGANIDPDKPPYDPALKDALPALKGQSAVIWVHVSSKHWKPSDPEGDERAVKIIQEIADLVAPSGLRVALYPHAGDWIERVEDAVRVAKKAERKNVGVTFNLCHWLRVTGGKDLEATLKQAMPYLFVVTINGADKDGKDWKTLIQTLDRGTYSVEEALKTLHRLGYQGPIGLQGYGIGGNVQDNLMRSMEAWRRLSAKAVSSQ